MTGEMTQFNCDKCGGNHPTDECNQAEEIQDAQEPEEGTAVIKEGELSEEEEKDARIKGKRLEVLESMRDTSAFFDAAFGEKSQNVENISRVLQKFDEEGLLPGESRFARELPDVIGEFSKMGSDLRNVGEEISQIAVRLRAESETGEDLGSLSGQCLEIEMKLQKMERELEERKHEIDNRINRLSELAYEEGWGEADTIAMFGKQFFVACDQAEEHLKSARIRWSQVAEQYNSLQRLKVELATKNEQAA